MALVKFDENKLPSWHVPSLRHRAKVNLKIPFTKDGILPAINYDRLKSLCNIEGLDAGDNGKSTAEAHEQFMSDCRSIFLEPFHRRRSSLHRDSLGRLSLIPSISSLMTSQIATNIPGTQDSHQKHSFHQLTDVSTTHDVRKYTRALHNVKSNTEMLKYQANSYKMLRRLLRKLPFERKPDDIEQMFNIMKTFQYMQSEVAMNVVKDLCMFASLVTMKEANFTVFGNHGLHLILKGSVRPQTEPYLRTKTTPMDFRTPTPLIEDSPIVLNVGDFFGTLRRVEGRESNSKILSVITLEPNCEFLKFSASDHTRVVDQILQRESTEKVNVLLSCDNYKLWPRQPLLKVAELLEWIAYSPNTVLVSEGYTAPYIGILRSGECHVLKQLEVIETLKNHKQVKRVRQVVMGKLEHSQTFGEISVLCNQPITCTIVSASDIVLGVIKPYKLKSLDETTTQLFIQSNTQTYGHLTKSVTTPLDCNYASCKRNQRERPAQDYNV